MFNINEIVMIEGKVEEIPVGPFANEKERDAALKKHFFFIK